ncbi:MAG: hypothetical protein ACR2OI_13180 [Acidimicrobiia bacterium]
MKHLVAAALTLTLIVAGILMATSLSSSAQEDGGVDETTTTTVADSDFLDHFELRFDGDIPPEVDEFLTCLEDEGVELPEEFDGSFRFGLDTEDIEGLSEALEVCGLPGIGPGFGGQFQFSDEFPEGFPFLDELPEGFPFGEGFGEGFGFGFRQHGVDRDELASCLAELGSFESVDEVRAQLDECLPAPPDLEDLEGFAPFGRGKHGDGGPFGGGFFHFGFEAPDAELDDTSA